MKFPVANVTVSVLNLDEILDRFQKVFLLKSAVFFNWAQLRKKVGNEPRLTLNVV